ncbi:polysaccharide deacetylase family protein [Roseibacillus ishigakijimensis]|uniref:polysaccharide deacetylase family protein n=1 Tax=Roseibacillus ishigakijimensis TaxID=454146 RepID=UPI00190553A2|nr:polysaccharide deacetylase family protein [Roseibacillus ishigakijimensis]
MKRFFLLFSGVLTLAACSADKTAQADRKAAVSNPPQVLMKPNGAYQTPPYASAAARNPTLSLPSNFSPNAGVTFTNVANNGNFIALTFDDGPHPKNTPRLLDILRQRNVKATFYVIGKSVKLYPDIVRRIHAEGHELGNHTWNHPNLANLSDAKVRQELDSTREAIISAAGVRPRTMRPPYGSLKTTQRQMIHRAYGYPTILWDVDPLDWKRPGTSVVRSRILNGTKSGSIVLAHDLHSTTVDAMPSTIDALLAKGYRFVTVSQLLAMKDASRP